MRAQALANRVLLLVSPNAAVHNRLIHKKHYGTVRNHTDEMRAKAAIKPAKALLANDGLCAVHNAAIVPVRALKYAIRRG